MFERVTSATFAPLTGEVFRVTPAGEDPIDLVLTDCQETRFGSAGDRGTADRRVPFSLLFHAPDGRLFAQQTCTVEHAVLGTFPLFLVPVGPDDRGMVYEAVFA